MTRFPPYVEDKLRAIGWYPGRDVSADFKFPPESRLNYGKLLKLAYNEGKHLNE